jgi:mercuric transport protein
MNSILSGIAAAGLIGTVAVCDLCPRPVEAASRGSVQAIQAEVKTVTFRVQGMTCGGCTIATRTVLERLEGVKKAEVSYEKSRAVVTYDPTKVSVSQMIAAVKTLGYTATVAGARQS